MAALRWEEEHCVTCYRAHDGPGLLNCEPHDTSPAVPPGRAPVQSIPPQILMGLAERPRVDETICAVR